MKLIQTTHLISNIQAVKKGYFWILQKTPGWSGNVLEWAKNTT